MKLNRLFIMLTAGICLLAMVVLFMTINNIMKKEITRQYEEKADMLLFSMKAVRSHVGSVVRPQATKILGPDEFMVELQSTSYAANRVFEAMPDEHKYGITFRTPSTKPMNPKNMANQVEADLIGILDLMNRDGAKNLEWRGIREVDGQDFYIIAQGAVNRASCLPCHRQPQDAPESMRTRYPFDSPPRLENRVETAEIVYIPMASLYQTIRESNNFLFILGGLGLLGIILALYFLFSRMISIPLNKLHAYTFAVEQGNLDSPIQGTFRGELASLKKAIQSMVQKLKDNILESIEKSNEAETQSAKAFQAAKEAEEAKKKGEQAQRDGMLQAAGRIEAVVERLTSASEEMAAQVKQASRGAEEQTSRTGETATAMEEMNATVLEVARNASQAAEASDMARTKAVDGSKVVSASVEAINKVQSQANEMKNNLGQLGQQAEQIGKIMTVIEDIADQTNLLALNAAIEAARAGDAGRGFAVVADEVRKLAEKTMNATKEVGQAIGAIQQGTRANIQGMDKSMTAIEEATKLANMSGDALREILALAEQAADQVRSIATAAEEQSATSEEINRGVEDIKRITMETSEVMQQSAQAIAELAGQAGGLKVLVQEMKQG